MIQNMILNKTEWIYTSYSLKNDYYILNLYMSYSTLLN